MTESIMASDLVARTLDTERNVAVLTSQVKTLSEDIDRLAKNLSQLAESTNASFRALADTTNQSIKDLSTLIQQTNTASTQVPWKSLSILAAFGVAIFSGMYLILSQQVINLVQPLQTAAATSLADRSDLRRDVTSISGRVFELTNKEASTTASNEQKFAEIETQFKALTQLYNIQAADALRWRGVMWQKIYGEAYPPFSYYPDISK